MEQYELYCLADRLFYDTPTNRGEQEPDFAACARPVPAGWQHDAGDVWMHYAPADADLPAQGWKIHVSAGLDDADRTIAAVWDYCVGRGLAFKFLRSKPVLMMFNSKSAFRGSSGKLVTIYPADEAQLELVLKELDGLLEGVQGPYILSDLRYADGPLFVRYGAFVTRYCLSDSGERVYALTNGEGRLVPDVRGATFSIPPWVTLPSFLEPHLEARNAVTTNELAYVIENVIQFSNGGGVYLGHHRDTAEKVVLKEGRPLAGLDALGRDAVARVGHERDILQRLAGLDVVPAVRDYFQLGDHHFLVQEFIDSNSLQRLIVGRYPLTRPDASAEQRTAYAEWALGTLARIEQAVAALHERGVVFNDLHPDNILIDADDRLVLIDFEVATLATEQARSALAHPGFAAPPDRHGVDVDRYALACLTLGLFAPQATMLLGLHPAKVNQLADLISETFQVPRATIAPAAGTVLGDRPALQADPPLPGKAPWQDLRSAITKAIAASATPQRDDRLFPGDIAQFEPGGGINLAYGAAGVLYALDRCGAGRFPEYEDWLRRQTRDSAAVPGLYNGLHGVALVLHELGHHQDGLDALDRGRTQPAEVLELGLYSGLAGIGLSLLHFGAEPAALAAATRIVDEVADRLGGPEDVAELSGDGRPRAGLMFGSSGPALLFLHAYERSGDTGLLDLAKIALQQDLRRCTADQYGMLQVNQGWRTLPYLEEGSAGIALVLDRYLRHRPDDELATALEPLRKVTRCGYFVQPGLFMGRAGVLLAAAQLEPSASEQLIAGLGWHSLPYGDGLAFPGNQLLRLSMDVATGSAGVLLALGAALHEQPAALPFLEPGPGFGSYQRREEV
ncbi:serine/threonine protein kinase [Kribbella flavida DSM 17836]|uniref:non-specific serine/threonine protein kinase n=1 Tax=Kribbella flavida (strain DSM 17836 / JCM 10339 / NBRC 14399) TaxID=479435 RepID=D2PW88_KRIFD|nr:class III lanthionine synthetase LanKC [Kribbella flavida]ADB31540.1 serine/threonine protein kinase [Kribbella flavida DSM 17836]